MSTIRWNALTGDWTTDADWDSGSVPLSGDDVLFNAGTATISTDVLAASLTFSDGGGTLVENSNASLTLSGALTLTTGTLQLDGTTTVASFAQSGGLLRGSGLVTVIGSAALGGLGGNIEETGPGTTDLKGDGTLSAVSNLILDGDRVLENEGTFAWQGGNFILSGASTSIDNVAGGTFDDQTDARISVFTDGTSFINAGTFTKSGGTGTTEIDAVFDNTGAVDVESGALSLGGGGTSSGDFSTASGATLNFAAGNFSITGGTIDSQGTFQVSNGSVVITPAVDIAGAVNIVVGTLELDGPATLGSLTQSGGLLTGSGLVTVTGAAELDGIIGNASQSGSGTTDLKDGGTLNGSNSLVITGSRVLENEGTLAWQNGSIILSGAGTNIDNVAGATFDDQTQTNANLSAFTAGTSFINAGMFKKSAGTGRTTIGAAFDNTGTVDVESGTLSFDGGGTSSGTFSVASGATLNFDGGTYSITGGNIAGLATITGGAILEIDTATTIDSLTQFGGTLSGSGVVTITGAANFTDTAANPAQGGTGTTVLEDGATLTGPDTSNLSITNSRVLENDGIFAWQGGNISVSADATIDNVVGATFDDQIDANISVPVSGGTFLNAGTFTKSAGTGTTRVLPAFDNTGRVAIDSGTLSLVGGGISSGEFSIASGATLKFDGRNYSITGGAIDSLGTFQVSGGTVAITTDLDIGGLVNHTLGNLQIDSTTTLASFAQSGGFLTGSGTVTITGPATFTDNNGNVEEKGTGTTDLKGDGTLNGTANLLLDGTRVFENEGTFAWQSGNIIFLSQGATIDNAAGGTFDDQTDGSISTFVAGATVTNAGTFRKSAGPGTTQIQTAFDNTGTVEVDSGTLDITGPLSGSGQFVISGPGAVLELNGGGDLFNGLQNAITESVTFGPAFGTLRLDDPLHFHGTINGFADGDVLDIANQTVTSALGVGNVLNLTLSTGAKLQYAMPGAEDLHFILAGDSKGGTDVVIDQFGVTPQITAPQSATVNQLASSFLLSGVSIADSNAVANSETIAVTVQSFGAMLHPKTGTQDQLLLSGTLAQVNAALATLTLFPVSGAIGFENGSVTIKTSDGHDGGDFRTIQLAVNVPPFMSGGPLSIAGLPFDSHVGAPVVNEGTSYQVHVALADADAVTADETFTVKVSDQIGSLSAEIGALGGGGTITGSGTNQLTIVGSLAEVNADLTTLTYVTNSLGFDLIGLTADDGRSGILPATATAGTTFFVTADAPPVTTVPVAAAVLQGVATAVTGISVADADADSAAEFLTVTLTDLGFGVLSATPAGGGTISGGLPNQITITGSLAQINADLATLSYFSPNGVNDTIDVVTSDGRGGSDEHVIAITAGNAAPSNVVPTSLLAQQGAIAAVPGVRVTDVDAVAAGEFLTVTLTDSLGSLSLAPFGSTVVGNSSGALTVSGSLDEINNALATLHYVSGTAGDDIIHMVTGDGRGGVSNDDQIAVDINAPPVTSVPGSQTVQPGGDTVAGISVFDPDADAAQENFTVTLTDHAGLLSATAAAGGSITGGGTTPLNIKGTSAQVNAALATLNYTSTNGASDLIDVVTNDGRGGSDEHSIAISVANAPPSNFVPASLSVQQDALTAIAGVSVGDADAALVNEQLTVTLSDSLGALSVAPNFFTNTSNGTSTLTITSDLAGINNALSTLQYFSSTPGNDSISIVTDDGRGGVSGQDHIAVDINAPPVVKVPGAQVVQPGVGSAITGIRVSDSDADAAQETISVTLTDTIGILTADADAPGGGGSIKGSGTNEVTIAGTETEVNADLASITYAATSPVNDQITVAADDGRGGSADFRAHGSISVAVNAPPVATAPANFNIPVNFPTALSGIAVDDADAVSAQESVKVTLSDSLGLFSVTNTGGSTIGGNNSTDISISGSLAQVKAGLGALTYLLGSNTTDTIDLRATDNRGGLDEHFITINPVPDAPPKNTVPVGTLLAQQGSPLSVSDVSVNDADAVSVGETLTVTLTDSLGALSVDTLGATLRGNGTKQLAISGSLGDINNELATLKYVASTSGSDTINVKTDDGRGGSDDDKIAVDVNAPPAISFAGSQIIQQGLTTHLGFTVVEEESFVGLAIVEQQLVVQPGPYITIADGDAISADENLKVTLSDKKGVLTASTNAFNGGGSISGSGSTDLTINGTLAEVNADLSTLDYLSDSAGTDTLDVSVTDNRGGSQDLPLQLTVNAPPLVTTAAAAVVVQIALASPVLVFHVFDDSQTVTASLEVTDVAFLSVPTGVAGGGTVNNGNGFVNPLTISGTVAQVNADLQALTIEDLSTNTAITMFVTDADGGSSSPVTFDNLVVNLPPRTTVPSSATVSQNVRTAISGINVADGDASQEHFTVTLTTSNAGTLSANTNVSGGGGSIRGAGTSQLFIAGTLAQVDADLTTLTYFNRSSGFDTIDVLTRDGRGGSDDDHIAVTIPFQISPPPLKLIKGYISGATVFADDSRNGALDPGEFSAITDATGGFTLGGGSGPLVAFGGTDTSTGLPFLGELTAPADSTVVTPLTTLLDLLERQNVGDAEAAVLGSLGLAPGLDLETLDPIAAAQGGNLVGGAAEVAAAKVYDTVSLITSALAGAGAAFTEAEQDTFAAIADAIAGPGLDLTDPAALTALIDGIAQSEGVTLSPAMASDVATILSTGNAALDHVAQRDATGAALLADTAGIEKLIQGTASSAFAQAGGDPTKVDSFAVQFTSADGLVFGAVAGQHALVLTGTPGDDILVGSRMGNNIIQGKAGNDVLTGGLGNDAFVFNFDVEQQTEIKYVPVTQHHHDFVSLANVTSVVVDDTIYYRPALSAAITAWKTWDDALTAYADSRRDNTGGDHFAPFTNTNPGRGRGGTVGTIQLIDGYYHDYDTTTLQKQTVTVTTVAGDGFDSITNFANPSLTVANGGAGADTMLFKGLSAGAGAINYWGNWLDSTSSGGNTTIHVHDVANHGADVAAITLAGVATDVGTLVHDGAIAFASR
jgi:hypothetical protein